MNVDNMIFPSTVKWPKRKLGDIFSFIGGGTPSKNNPDYWGGNIPWASIKDVKGAYLTKTIDMVSEEGVANSATNLANVGDLIVATRINPGRPIITKIKTAINQDLKIIRAKIDVDTKYLYYIFLNYERDILKLSSGTTVLGIRLDVLNHIEIPVPEKTEQLLLVAKIEELFSELDKGIESLKIAQDQLKGYRRSLLDTTVGDGEHRTISSVVHNMDQGWSPRCLNESSDSIEEWAVIKTTAIQHGEFVPSANKKLPETLPPRKQHELKRGDILITRAGPRVRVGVCCLIRETRPRLINCDKAYRIRVDEKLILPEYLELLLNTPFYIKKIEQIKTGINDSGVNLTQSGFLNITIPVPTLETQRLKVQGIESRLTIADQLEKEIETNLRKAETLRQSILKQAFEGKLV